MENTNTPRWSSPPRYTYDGRSWVPGQPQALAQGTEAGEARVEASGPEPDAMDGAVRRVTDRIGELTIADPGSSPEVRLIRALLEEVYRRA